MYAIIQKFIKTNRRIISPLDQTWDTFWVKNENNDMNTCLRYKRNHFRNNLDRRVTTTSCNAKHTYICEKNLK